MTNIKGIKFNAMRLKKDFSNSAEFAYFVGGMAHPMKGNSLNLSRVITMFDLTFYPGFYAVEADGKIQRWKSETFEELFTFDESIDMVPAGWEPHSEADMESFGVHTPVSREDFTELRKHAVETYNSTRFSRQAKQDTLMALPTVKRFEELLQHPLSPNHIYAMTRADGVNSDYTYADFLSRAEVTLPNGANASILYLMGGKELFVSNYTASLQKIQEHLNREYYLWRAFPDKDI